MSKLNVVVGFRGHCRILRWVSATAYVDRISDVLLLNGIAAVSIYGTDFWPVNESPCMLLLGLPPNLVSPSPSPAPPSDSPGPTVTSSPLPSWISQIGAAVLDTTGGGAHVPQRSPTFPPFDIDSNCLGVALLPPFIPGDYRPFLVTGVALAFSDPNVSIVVQWCGLFDYFVSA